MIYDGGVTQKHYNNICLEVVAAVIHTTTYICLFHEFFSLSTMMQNISLTFFHVYYVVL